MEGEQKLVYLVTGGTGFIGAYVVRNLLEAGEEVVCFQRSGITPLFQEVVSKEHLVKVKVVQGSVADTLDLFDTVCKYKVDSIIHLAYVLYPYSEVPPLALRINVIGSNNVFEAARLFGVRRVVWTSTFGVFGRLGQFYGDKVVFEKDVVYRPTRLYGATKALVEFLTNQYNEQFGVDIIGLRCARIYGIGKLSGGGMEFTQLLRQAALDQPVTIGGGDERWVYGHVEDVAQAILKACTVSST